VLLATSQSTATHVTSMIVHGVFEKYPNLRYLMAEPGVSWLTWLVAKLESNYELMKTESSWVKKRPLEYLHDHCGVTTQPCEATAQNKANFIANLSLIDGIEDILCFSSDYPHWDGDDATYVAAILPKAWHRKVFYENASRILRLPNPSRLKQAQPALA
jgi:predicted TIM-barrel fold metal-dependent hydrolase